MVEKRGEEIKIDLNKYKTAAPQLEPPAKKQISA